MTTNQTASGPAGQDAFFAALVESSEDAIYAQDPTGTVLSWNRGAETLYGYTRKEMVGKSSAMLISEDQLALSEEFGRRLLSGETLRPFESIHLRKDGKPVAVSMSVSRVETDRGVAIACIARDVTERLRADEKARDASEYARNLIESSLDPLVTISPEGKITDVNEATIKVTGVARAQLIGTDFFDYFVEPEKAREGYQQVFSQGSVTDYPLTIRHRNGRLTDVLYNASVYRDADGQRARCVRRGS